MLRGLRCLGVVWSRVWLWGFQVRRVLSSEAVMIVLWVLSIIAIALMNESWPSSTPIFSYL